MNRSNRTRLGYILLDSASILVSTILLNTLRFHWEFLGGNTWANLKLFLFHPKSIAVTFIIWLFWLLLFSLSGYYNKAINKSRIDELFSTITSVFLGTTLIFFSVIINDFLHDPYIYVELYATYLLETFGIVYLSRLIFTSFLLRQRSKQQYWPRVILIGTPKEVEKLVSLSEQMRFIPLQKITFLNGETEYERVSREIEDSIQKYNPSDLYLTSTPDTVNYIGHLLYKLYSYKCQIHIAVEDGLLSSSIHSTILEGIPLIDITETRMSEFGKNIKYCFDRVFSFLLLLLLCPIFIILALLVRKSSKGPIFFSQERIGKRGKPFQIYKFRTMYTDSEQDGPKLSYDGDPRITPIGRILRKYRLDELPQLYNVLKGDMSFVGPRPERQYYISKLLETAPYYYFLHNVLPGITSWGMVKYGYASTLEEMKERVKYDWIYYSNMSIKLDITILLHTITVLVKGSGK